MRDAFRQVTGARGGNNSAGQMPSTFPIIDRRHQAPQPPSPCVANDRRARTSNLHEGLTHPDIEPAGEPTRFREGDAYCAVSGPTRDGRPTWPANDNSGPPGASYGI